MDDELRELQEYSEQVEAFRMEQRKNKTSMTPDSVQSMDVSQFFEEYLENAKKLEEEEIEKSMECFSSLGTEIEKHVDQAVSEALSSEGK